MWPFGNNDCKTRLFQDCLVQSPGLLVRRTLIRWMGLAKLSSWKLEINKAGEKTINICAPRFRFGQFGIGKYGVRVRSRLSHTE